MQVEECEGKICQPENKDIYFSAKLALINLRRANTPPQSLLPAEPNLQHQHTEES